MDGTWRDDTVVGLALVSRSPIVFEVGLGIAAAALPFQKITAVASRQGNVGLVDSLFQTSLGNLGAIGISHGLHLALGQQLDRFGLEQFLGTVVNAQTDFRIKGNLVVCAVFGAIAVSVNGHPVLGGRAVVTESLIG